MRSILRKIKRFFRIFVSIMYLIYCRIKFRKKTKAVAQVVNSFNNGGLEQVAANIYKAFRKNGNNSFVITVSNNVGPICSQLESPAHLRIIYYDFAEMIKFCAKNNIGTLVFHFSTYHMIFLKLLGFKNYYVVHNTYMVYKEGVAEFKNKIKIY